MATTTRPKTVRQVLLAARALIKDPKRWCQGEYGRTASGRRSGGRYDPDINQQVAMATKRCAVGAVYAVTGDHNAILSWRAQQRLGNAAKALGFSGELELNDTTDHAAVMRMYAIALGQRKAPKRAVAR